MLEVHGPVRLQPEAALDYPSFQLATSGVFDGNRLLTSADAIDIGRVAIGQERLR